VRASGWPLINSKQRKVAPTPQDESVLLASGLTKTTQGGIQPKAVRASCQLQANQKQHKAVS